MDLGELLDMRSRGETLISRLPLELIQLLWNYTIPPMFVLTLRSLWENHSLVYKRGLQTYRCTLKACSVDYSPTENEKNYLSLNSGRGDRSFLLVYRDMDAINNRRVEYARDHTVKLIVQVAHIMWKWTWPGHVCFVLVPAVEGKDAILYDFTRVFH